MKRTNLNIWDVLAIMLILTFAGAVVYFDLVLAKVDINPNGFIAFTVLIVAYLLIRKFIAAPEPKYRDEPEDRGELDDER